MGWLPAPPPEQHRDVGAEVADGGGAAHRAAITRWSARNSTGIIETVAVPALVDELAELLVSSGAIKTAEVKAAFRAVPRHLFVPGVGVERAYRDEAIPTKVLNGRVVSSASQPSIVAVKRGGSPASFDGSSLGVLGRQDDQLVVHAFGDDTDAADRLANTVTAWVAAGRPGSESLMLRVRPGSETIHDADGVIVIRKQWTTLFVQWPDTSVQLTESQRSAWRQWDRRRVG